MTVGREISDTLSQPFIELTNATTTQLLNPSTGDWSRDLVADL